MWNLCVTAAGCSPLHHAFLRNPLTTLRPLELFSEAVAATRSMGVALLHGRAIMDTHHC